MKQDVEVFTYDANKYASEQMKEIPLGNIDKGICACGLTTIALENDISTIVAVPTIALILNKANQYPDKNGKYPGDRCSNEVLAVYGKTGDKQIEDYLDRVSVIKIMCTFDSLQRLEDRNDSRLSKCLLVLDEVQELITLTQMKSDGTYNPLMKVYDIIEKRIKKVSLITATPIPLEYHHPCISKLHQIKFEWTNTTKVIPMTCKNRYPYTYLRDMILKPLQKYKTKTFGDRTFNKVIVFLNTIDEILKAVIKCGIPFEDCAIICGNGIKNDAKIDRKIGRLKDPSKLPRFTFITGSGFAGIDLYDKEAMTVIVSSTSKQWRMVDMQTDLRQAASRQRNKTNPNFDTFIYIYDQAVLDKTEEELLADLEKSRISLNKTISLWNYGKEKGLIEDWVDSAQFKAFSYPDNKTGLRIINEQLFKSVAYFIKVIRNQYAKGFDIKTNLGESKSVSEGRSDETITFKILAKYARLIRKDGIIDWGPYHLYQDWVALIDDSFRYCGQVWDNMTNTQDQIANEKNKISGFRHTEKLLGERIIRSFSEERIYGDREIVKILQGVYDGIGLKVKANVKDIIPYMDIKKATSRGKRGFKLSVLRFINELESSPVNQLYKVSKKVA